MVARRGRESQPETAKGISDSILRAAMTLAILPHARADASVPGQEGMTRAAEPTRPPIERRPGTRHAVGRRDAAQRLRVGQGGREEEGRGQHPAVLARIRRDGPEHHLAGDAHRVQRLRVQRRRCQNQRGQPQQRCPQGGRAARRGAEPAHAQGRAGSDDGGGMAKPERPSRGPQGTRCPAREMRLAPRRVQAGRAGTPCPGRRVAEGAGRAGRRR